MENPEVFEGTSFQDLLQEIHSLAGSRRKQITTVMDTLAKLITNINDAAVIAPLVKDYMDVSVRSDEALVKIATIKQRLMSAEPGSSTGGSDVLTDEEKDAIIASVRELEEESNKDALKELAVTIEARTDIDTDLAELNKQASEVLTNMAETDES